MSGSSRGPHPSVLLTAVTRHPDRVRVVNRKIRHDQRRDAISAILWDIHAQFRLNSVAAPSKSHRSRGRIMAMFLPDRSASTDLMEVATAPRVSLNSLTIWTFTFFQSPPHSRSLTLMLSWSFNFWERESIRSRPSSGTRTRNCPPNSVRRLMNGSRRSSTAPKPWPN